jgi:hypothetical protein
MKRKSIFVLTMVILLSASVWAGTYSGGYGSAENPYIIATAEDLDSIGANPNDWDANFVMVNDINLADYTGNQFNIIGTYYNNAFTGVFDGNNYTISNFNYSSAESGFIGIFGVCNENAEIKDLGLREPNVNVGRISIVGSLVGSLERGTIIGCFVDGGRVSGGESLGGLVGENRFGTIRNCYASCSVSGSRSIGGLVGKNVAGDIYSCYATGNVTASRSNIGGLIGNNSFGNISKSFATGNVIGRNSQSNQGGLVGQSGDGSILDCYASGDVSGGYNVGGLVGASWGTISNCYSIGYVTGLEDIGGFVGDGIIVVINSFWDIQTSGQLSSAGGAGAMGKTTAEMQSKSTFINAGWDFTTPIWKMCDGPYYPRLWREECPEPVTYYVDAADGNDDNDGLSLETALATIQAAINAAYHRDTVIVQPGLYDENINFLGKNITLTSTIPANPDIVANTIFGRGDVYFPAVIFRGTEDPNCSLIGFNINGSIDGFDWFIDPPPGNTRATISHCAFTGNAVPYGTVIYGCDGIISNCLIADNFPSDTDIPDIEPTIFYCHGLIKNCTIVNNCWVGIALRWIGGHITIENCIIWGNGGDQIDAPSRGTVNIRYTNIQGGLGGIGGGGTVNWGPGNIDSDPCFVREGYWEYNEPNRILFEGDYHLLRTSPCIDAANDANVYTDIEGNPRPFDFPGVDNNGELPDFDMGAYEATAEKAQLMILPRTINRTSRQKRILAWLRLPESITKDQIDNDTPLVLYPGNIESTRQYVFQNRRRKKQSTSIFAFFDKEQLITAIGNNGRVQLQVLGH